MCLLQKTSATACEMFVLGNRDFRLPGLGSYLQTAANAGDTRAILYGIAAMIGTIILMDQVIWRPVIAWAQKFKLEQVGGDAPRSPILSLLRSSRLLPFVSHAWIFPLREKLDLHFARKSKGRSPSNGKTKRSRWFVASATVLALAGIAYAVAKMLAMISTLSVAEICHILLGAGVTFLRVEFALLLAATWTIPAGVAIGLRPRLSAIAQPIAQVAASVPATALFPIILMILIRAGGGLGIGSIVLLLIGTQWYILFNVIAGATAIPTDLKEVCSTYRLSLLDRWRTLFLPAIFPYLITGFVTASGGAWNASIVAEYFHFRGETISTLGLGSIISQATDSGNFRVLLAATVIMAMIVVTINRLVWRRLFAIATTRFTLQE
jgi:NitT/TauT family transport system permease protein